MPLVEALAAEGIAVGVDTRKPAVMRAAIAAGAAMINDIARACASPARSTACAASDVGVCLMHMQGEPRTMQAAPAYDDVVAEVRDFLLARAPGVRRRRHRARAHRDRSGLWLRQDAGA